jgi:protein gp37
VIQYAIDVLRIHRCTPSEGRVVSGKTAISWATDTWSPVLGCSPVSAGCAHCYAIRTTWRLAHNPNPKVSGPRQGLVDRRMGDIWGTAAGALRWTGGVACLPDELDTPLHWKKPRRIFVNSMSDLFHPEVPDEFIRQVLDVTASAYWHQFLILTKRPDRMRRFSAGVKHWQKGAFNVGAPLVGWPENVWLGVSIENQETADERIPILLDTPAAHRFVSAEPLLGPIRVDDMGDGREGTLKPLVGLHWARGKGPRLDWVIVGGESGPGARPCKIEWIHSIVEQCKTASTSCFVKQLGSYYRSTWSEGAGITAITHSGRNPSEWPDSIRVQQFPEGMP